MNIMLEKNSLPSYESYEQLAISLTQYVDWFNSSMDVIEVMKHFLVGFKVYFIRQKSSLALLTGQNSLMARSKALRENLVFSF